MQKINQTLSKFKSFLCDYFVCFFSFVSNSGHFLPVHKLSAGERQDPKVVRMEKDHEKPLLALAQEITDCNINLFKSILPKHKY